MKISLKLTEDETINKLISYLKANGWFIESHCLGQARGCDIVAVKGNDKLFVEVKGAKAGENSPTKKREYFNSGQIKTHFGKAIVKVLNDKHLNPEAMFAIAHPNDNEIKKAIGHLIPYLKIMGIKHYWVSLNGDVIED